MSIFDGFSPEADSIRMLWFLVLAVCLVIFVLVEGMLIWCLVRFRHKGGAEPPQIYGSKPIEVAWTVAPLLIVFVLFLVVVRTVAEVQPQKPLDNALHVTVVGHQWWWEYQYYEMVDKKPKLLFKTANELHVPVGRQIWLDLESADVIHSFWVPNLAGKTDTIPGRTNHANFTASKTGVFDGGCAEYCGNQHANMLIRVVVDSPEDYQKWAANQQSKPVDEAAGAAGKKRFLELSCVNCHSIQGLSAGTFAPDLTHLMSRKYLATMPTLPNDRATMKAWLKDPNKLKPGCNMPDFKLNPQDVDRLTDYLMTLR